MLLRLTCPSCGRVEQAFERVLGKEIRCPCGTQFRVLQPKPAAPELVAGEPRRREHAQEPQPAPPRRQSEARPRPHASSRPRENSQAASRLAYALEREEAAERPVRYQPKRKQSTGMPPWAYAAVGAGGVMSLLLMIFVIRTLIGNPGETIAPRGTGNEIASLPEARPARASIEDTTASTELERASERSPARTASARTGAGLSTAEIVARCEPSVALIKGRVGSGTGFVIKRGIVATNSHVIEEELISGLEVRFPGAPAGKQGPLPAQLLYEDRKRDLAFLAVATDLPALELVRDYAFQKGEDITVIGSPGLGEDVVLENAISRGVMSAKIVIEGMNYYQMSIAINPGNSGGPVFDSTGRVIGVATLKANKAEAMGFCIPVEELRVATKELGQSHPEMIARHRAVATFKALTLAGVIYVFGIVARSGHLQGADAEDVQKLQEAVKSLDEKLFSLIDAEVYGLQNESSLSPRTRRNYQELSANYKAMKRVYGYGPGQVNQSANHIEDLRKQHLSLVVAIRDELQVEVAAKVLAVLKEPLTANQQKVVVVETMPSQMQPRFRRPRPGMGMGPRAQMGPGAGMNPGQSMHDQMLRQMEQQRRQMENQMRNMQPH
jgi:S1-C subfamily serine protease